MPIRGWFETAFTAGSINRPNPRPTPVNTVAGERLIRVQGAIAYTEMALVLAAIPITLLSPGAANRIAPGACPVLFFAPKIARLDLSLGVPNINDAALPVPVRYLTRHYCRAPKNGFFPLSIMALTFAPACWIVRAAAMPAGYGGLAGYVPLGAQTALASSDRRMMVLPPTDAALWRWLLLSPRNAKCVKKTPGIPAQEEGL